MSNPADTPATTATTAAPAFKPRWVTSPTLARTDVLDPHGRVTGRVTVCYVRGDLAYVSTDDVPVHYRGHDFAVAAHLARAADGTWSPRRDPHLTYHGRHPVKDAPPTYAADLLAAIVHTAGHHWTPELGRDADHAHAVQRLSVTADELDTARAEVARLEADRAPHLETVRAHTADAAGGADGPDRD